MNPERVDERGLRRVGTCVGVVLLNYELRFNKRSRKAPNRGHANIVPQFGSKVEGVLYELVCTNEIRKMDPFEHAPIDYRREIVFVRHSSTAHLAWTYIANESVIDDTLRPPRWYVDHLLAGQAYLSPKYVDFINSIECRS